MGRLETVDRQLARELAAAGPIALRQVAAAIAEFAVVQTDLHDPRADAALRQLRGETHSQHAESELARLVEQLDERQWALQDRVDAGEASPQEHVAAFAQARAAAALSAAFDSDPVVAAQEAAYEAFAAVDDPEAIRRIADEQLAT
jgi:hypothetical protein